MKRLLPILAALIALALPAAAHASAWDEPALTNPVTVQLSDSNRNLKLSQAVDYVLTCPGGQVQATWGLVVWGGHNVAFEHCDYENSGYSYGAQFKNQTGALWLHDVHFGGPQLSEGIDLQEYGATVVMRDIVVDTVHGSQTANHADLIQAWAGPGRLLVDGFTGSTQYQGFFLLPNQQDSTTVPSAWDFRNVDIAATGAYSLWFGDLTTEAAVPTWNVQSVYVSGSGEPRDSDGTHQTCGLPVGCGHAWDAVRAGFPPSGGHYVWPVPGGAYGIDDPTPLAVLAGEQ